MALLRCCHSPWSPSSSCPAAILHSPLPITEAAAAAAAHAALLALALLFLLLRGARVLALRCASCLKLPRRRPPSPAAATSCWRCSPSRSSSFSPLATSARKEGNVTGVVNPCRVQRGVRVPLPVRAAVAGRPGFVSASGRRPLTACLTAAATCLGPLPPPHVAAFPTPVAVNGRSGCCTGIGTAGFRFRKGCLTNCIYDVHRLGAAGFLRADDLRRILLAVVELQDLLDHTAMPAMPRQRSICLQSGGTVVQ